MELTTLIPAVIVGLIVTVLIGAAIFYRRRSETLTMDIGGGGPKAAGGSDNSADNTVRTRLAGLGVFVGGALGILLSKLWSMQLVSSDEYARLAERNRTRTISTEAPRGRILDRNGMELVRNRPSPTVVANQSVLDDEVKLTLLANLLGMPKIAAKRKIQDESEGAQRARTVAKDASSRAVAFIDEHSFLFEGVSIEDRTQRNYPFGNLASQVLGYTGNVTQELLAESETSTDSDSISYELGDTVGQAGVEYQYESVLQGIRGEQTVYVDANGNVTDYSNTIDAQSGADVVLTLDAKIQRAAEDGLAHAIQMSKKHGHDNCACGAVIVLDAKDGGILAMASAPTFSPNVFSGGISLDDWEAISSDESRYPLMNRAISGLYPSASTIKPLSTFAALDFGVATFESQYVCTGFWTGFGEEYGQYCWNHDGHG
ncbi:MAG: penicillin-binding protein 2, partial [Atopobiaceae bacterium]|nr:penicillin-binding protein 2 [Atopobiaceae bacterium]